MATFSGFKMRIVQRDLFPEINSQFLLLHALGLCVDEFGNEMHYLLAFGFDSWISEGATPHPESNRHTSQLAKKKKNPYKFESSGQSYLGSCILPSTILDCYQSFFLVQ